MARTATALRAGDLLLVGAAASVQFGSGRGFPFRVIRELPWETCVGWVWLEGYVLNPVGDAVERRSIFVWRAGLLPWSPVVGGRRVRGQRAQR